MNYHCLKNMHFFFPVWPRLYWNKKQFLWTAVLDESCGYEFDRDGMKALNKLAGLSKYIFNPRKDSVRFVWKWDQEINKFRIFLYVEKKKEFKNTIYPVGAVGVGEAFTIGFDYSNPVAKVRFNSYMIDLPIPVYTGLFYRLNPYFGGKRPAPHKMKIFLKKII